MTTFNILLLNINLYFLKKTQNLKIGAVDKLFKFTWFGTLYDSCIVNADLALTRNQAKKKNLANDIRNNVSTVQNKADIPSRGTSDIINHSSET